jgi:pyrimidine deaminase RibD-like protein
MRSSDFEITNEPKLDRLLAQLVEMVIDGQHGDSEQYGLVAAGVLDNDGRFITGLNTLDPETDTRIHAERTAINKYNESYGEVPAGSIIITTLSPCTDPEMSERYDSSCDELINSGVVRKVWCGYVDHTQDKNQRKEYHLECTRNKKLNQMCQKIASLFLK